MFFDITRFERKVCLDMFLKKMTPNYPEKEKFRVIMMKKKLLWNFVKSWGILPPFFYQAIEIVLNYIRNRFQQKDHIETLQKMEIRLLKALRNEDLIMNFNKCLWTTLMMKKQVRIKEAITIISSLNASQKLLVSEALLS